MHRFLAERTGPDTACLNKEESQHLTKVLRMAAGDACQAMLSEGLFAAEVLETGEKAVLLLKEALPSPEAGVRITLYQGLPKGDKIAKLLHL